MAGTAQFGHIGPREREILTAIVQAYISTGEPVGSRTLSRLNSEGLSAATIRNVMSDLAEAGYLEQPHTSAGRVPTPAAFRLFVDQLGTAPLSAKDQSMIRGSFAGVGDVHDFMERTSHVLSMASRGVGVAIAGGRQNALDHIYFSRLGDHKVLAVVVTRGGIVRDRLLRTDGDLTQADLDLAARFINENYTGWTMDALRSEVERQIERERSEYDQLTNSLKQLYAKGALASDEHGVNVWLDGASNLIESAHDVERLRQLLKALEEKQRIVELLNAYLDSQQEAVRVVIGLDQAPPDLRNFVLIGAPARVGEEVMGSVAVIGPTRIDYQHTITVVKFIARLFDEIVNGPAKQ